MPIVKISLEDLDPESLEAEEYDDSQDFEPYDGPQPRAGIVLSGILKKAWWTYTAKEKPMIKVLFEAAGNEGEREVFNGLPIWDNVVLQNNCAFRYKPFFAAIGVTMDDVSKKTNMADDDENQGAPILAIAKWKPGTDATIRISTKLEKRAGYEPQTKVGKWLPALDREDDADEGGGEAEEAKPRRGAAAKPAAAKSARRGAKPADNDTPF